MNVIKTAIDGVLIHRAKGLVMHVAISLRASLKGILMRKVAPILGHTITLCRTMNLCPAMA